MRSRLADTRWISQSTPGRRHPATTSLRDRKTPEGEEQNVMKVRKGFTVSDEQIYLNYSMH